MADSVNMSLDDIIKQNRSSRSRGRGGGSVRSRGGGRGRGGRGRGRGGVTRSRSQTRPNTPSGARRGRSRSRGPGAGQGGRFQSRSRSQSRNRSRSQSRNRSRSRQRRSNSRARSASRSRSQLRGLTPKGRAGLEEQMDMPNLVRGGRMNRGGMRGRGRLQRANSYSDLQSSVHSRLGVTTRRGMNNIHRPLAVAKRGISKRGRGLTTGNKYSAVGLRSDQIIQEQHQNMLLRNNIIRSQTFTRSRNNSFSKTPSQLTVTVANDYALRRRNSVGSAGYLNRQSLAQLNNQYGGYNTRRGPGSVKSMGSNRSNRSNRSTGSRSSNRSQGRGRGRNRRVGRKFIKPVLNEQLQKEIAVIQYKANGSSKNTEAHAGIINFSPTPTATDQSLNQRFAAS